MAYNSTNSILSLKPEYLKSIKVAKEIERDKFQIYENASAYVKKITEVDAKLKILVIGLLNSSSIEEMREKFISGIKAFPNQEEQKRIYLVTLKLLTEKIPEDSIRMWNLSEKEIEPLTKFINNFKNITEILVEFNIKIASKGIDLIKVVEFKDKELKDIISSYSSEMTGFLPT